MYHLPFAALRGGLSIPYEMNEAMTARYQGFPPLPHFLQGVLWRLTGSVNATGVVGCLAFLGFLAYCHRALRASFWLVALIALTAPMVVIHSAASYVDLFGNSLLAIGIASCLHLHLAPERSSRLHLYCGLLGLIGAAWSKFQLVAIIALVFCLYAAVCLRAPGRFGLGRKRLALILIAAALLAALPYLKNFVQYGNPFWPVKIPFLPRLPFVEDEVAQGAAKQTPPPLLHYSGVRLFLHSLFEIDHPTSYPHRPRWIIDQGNAWISFRMGGFWGIGAAIYLAATLFLLALYDRRAGIAAGLAWVGLLCAVAALPQSHDLRYYLFIPLVWAAAIGMLFPRFQQKLPRVALASLLLVAGLFGYMVSENWTHYRIERRSHLDAARELGASAYWSLLSPGRRYCAVDMVPMGILLTGPTLTEYAIADRSKRELCPEGAIVLTREEPSAGKSALEYLEQGAALYIAGRYDQSIAANARAIALQPDLAEAYNNICAANIKLGRWEAAIASCQRALALKPDLERARKNLMSALQMKAGKRE
jgi:tetratricopeptide (TPR) repeat protein